MAAAHDVAAYVLSKKSPMTAMKLQKLLYYSQAWSLVWNDKPLFKARRGARPGQQTQNEITTAAMAEYYSSL